MEEETGIKTRGTVQRRAAAPKKEDTFCFSISLTFPFVLTALLLREVFLSSSLSRF